MPKNLDKKELLQYKKILLTIREKVSGEIKKISDDTSAPQKDATGDSAGHGLHLADVASDMYDREFSLGLASNDRELLQKISDALRRIEDNTFGLCAECTKPIASIRLKAIPYAKTCLKCQEKIESK